jgi:hypothetical protein
MSITLTRRRRASSSSEAEASAPSELPSVLPVVTMTVQPDASLSVAVDGRRFDPPAFSPRWQRHSFAEIINEVMEQRRSPVRVVINEQDGSVYTDIVTQPIRDTPPSGPSEPRTAVMAAPDVAMPAPLLAVQGDEGFVPGEQVAVAVIIRHTVAQSEGSARSLVEPGFLELSPTREVILLGRVSGTCVVEQPT